MSMVVARAWTRLVGLSVALALASPTALAASPASPAPAPAPRVEPPPAQPELPRLAPPEPGWNLQAAGIVLTAAGGAVTSGLTVAGIGGALGLGPNDDVTGIIMTVYMFAFPTMVVVGTALTIAGGVKTRRAQQLWETQVRVGARRRSLRLRPGAGGLTLQF